MMIKDENILTESEEEFMKAIRLRIYYRTNFNFVLLILILKVFKYKNRALMSQIQSGTIQSPV